MEEDEILQQQEALDKATKQKIVGVDTSFCQALGFKLETNETPLYKRSWITQFIVGLKETLRRSLPFGNSKTA